MYKDKYIHDIYIESIAINPISAFLLLKIGFSAVSYTSNDTDDNLTEQLKSMSFEELNKIIKKKGFICTRFYINRMTYDDVINIKKQITTLIIGTKTNTNNKTSNKTHKNTNFEPLKCLSNNNNKIGNITNDNRSKLLSNNTALPFNISNSNLEETGSEYEDQNSQTFSSYLPSNNNNTQNRKNSNSNNSNSNNSRYARWRSFFN